MLKKKNSLPNMETVVPFPVSDVLHITRPDMEELLVWRQQNHEMHQLLNLREKNTTTKTKTARKKGKKNA